MELAVEVCKHFTEDLNYSSKIEAEHIRPAMQGVGKAIFEFLLEYTRSPKEIKMLRTNLSFNSTDLRLLKTIKIKEDFQQLLHNIHNKHAKLKKATADLQVSDAIETLPELYIESLIDKVNTIRKSTLLLEYLTKQYKESLNQASEFNPDSLTSVLSETKDPIKSPNSNHLSAKQVKRVLDGLKINISSDKFFQQLMNKKVEHIEKLDELIKCPQDSLPVLNKEAQDQDETSRMVEKLANEIKQLRDRQWKDFMDIESIITKTKLLRNQFKQLSEHKENMAFQPSASILKMHKAEISYKSRCAEVEALRNQLEYLNRIKEELQDKKMVLWNRQKLKDQINESRNELDMKISRLSRGNQNTRKAICKYKLRIQDFIDKHFKPLQKELHTSLVHFKESSNLELTQFLCYGTKLLQTNSILSETIRKDEEEDSFILLMKKDIDNLSFPDFTTYNISTDDLEYYSQKIQLLKDRLCYTQQHFEIFKSQPAQHCIPWRKDHCGKNITEWLNEWREKYRIQ